MNEQEKQTVNDQPVETAQDQFFGIKNAVVTKAPEVEVIETESAEPQIEALVEETSVKGEIEDIRRRFEAEKKAKDAALGAEKEAVNQLRQAMTDNQRLYGFVSRGGQELNQQALNNAQWAKHSAMNELKAANDEGDSDAMAQAQEKLSQATLAEQQAGNYADYIMQQANKDMPPVRMPQQQTEKPQLDPDMQTWSDKNSWFMNNKDPNHQKMTSYALYLDQEIREEGVDPAGNSEKYYSEVDTRMRNRFPDFFGVQPKTTEVGKATTKQQPASVVAPSSRHNGKKARKVSLTKDQLRVARQLGVSPQAYASQYLKLEEGSYE